MAGMSCSVGLTLRVVPTLLPLPCVLPAEPDAGRPADYDVLPCAQLASGRRQSRCFRQMLRYHPSSGPRGNSGATIAIPTAGAIRLRSQPSSRIVVKQYSFYRSTLNSVLAFKIVSKRIFDLFAKTWPSTCGVHKISQGKSPTRCR